MRLSCYSLPEGFVVDNRNIVMWATGHRYIRDGTNPDRVEVLELFRDGLYLSWSAPASLRAATKKEASAWVARLRERMDANKASAMARCIEERTAFEATASEYERRLAALLEGQS